MSDLAVQPVPAVGSPAPDFTLPSTGGGTVTLSDFRGKRHVLIAFFPAAFTSVCTAEMCAFNEQFDAFAGRDVAILPISVDAVPSLREYKAKYAMQTDLLSDFRREVSARYGVLDVARYASGRANFQEDREGTLRWAHVEEHTRERRENEEILARIAELG